MLRNVFSKGCEYHYECEDCLALFKVKPSSMGDFDINTCILCTSKDKQLTPKLSQEQIDVKKQELKERLKNR